MRLSFWRALPPLLLAGACTFPDYAYAPAGGGAGAAGAAGAAGSTSTCSDGIQGSNETGIDCGGVCKACEVTTPLPVCSDGERGKFETGVDCGGPCPGCVAYQDCIVADDCESVNCEQGVCQPASCTDSAKNGSESDVDCGGPCPPCGSNATCGGAADCASGVCTAAKCQKASCADAVTNGTETGVDCGGTCASCNLGMPCQAATDCTSGSCDATQDVCVTPGCQNQVKNGLETDQDCGGGQCAPCVAGQSCIQNGDCDSSLCNSGTKRCLAATCTDSVLNQDESDKDCGGGKCAHCGNGARCRSASDCASGLCQTNFCVPAKPTGMPLLDQTGWIPTASDTFGDSSTKSLLDGDPNVRWTSGKQQYAGMFVKIDMQKPQILFKITLDTSNWPSDAGKGYDVSFSNDGVSFSEPKLFSGGKPVQDLSFETAVVARFIRITLTGGGTEWWSVGELTVTQ